MEPVFRALEIAANFEIGGTAPDESP